MSKSWQHAIPGNTSILLAVILSVGWGAPSEASESNLSSVVEGQPVVHPGDVVTFCVRYSNSGPDDATTPYVNLSIQSGLPAPIHQITQQQIDHLQQSALGTDTLGNTPLLFMDSAGCEHLFFQLQGPSPPDPVQGLTSGAEGSFSFDLEVPMDPPPIGGLVITEPAGLAAEFLPALTNHQLFYDDGETRRYGRGLNCNNVWGQCTQMGDCFGARLSMTPAFSAELVAVDDGGVLGDPGLGCGALVGPVAGRIAVIRRGGCYFIEKAWYAQTAGAVAAIIVNNGQCENLGPHSRDCVINMNGGYGAGVVEIPVIMISLADGEPILEVLAGGGTVRATLGAMHGGSLELSSDAFLVDSSEIDCDPTDNGDALRVRIGLFADGLETGTDYEWSDVVD